MYAAYTVKEKLGGGEKTSKNDLGRNWKSDIKVFYAVVNKSRVDLIRSFLTTKSETRLGQRTVFENHLKCLL